MNDKNKGMFKLINGKYKIFYNSGTQFIQKSTINNNNEIADKKEQSKVIFTLMSTAEIKLSEGEVLLRRKDQLEDQTNIYLL